jgi:hypothetical protein
MKLTTRNSLTKIVGYLFKIDDNRFFAEDYKGYAIDRCIIDRLFEYGSTREELEFWMKYLKDQKKLEIDDDFLDSGKDIVGWFHGWFDMKSLPIYNQLSEF